MPGGGLTAVRRANDTGFLYDDAIGHKIARK